MISSSFNGVAGSSSSRFFGLLPGFDKLLYRNGFSLRFPFQEQLLARVVDVYPFRARIGAPFYCQRQSLAELLETTVGYLLGEAEQADALKGPAMLKRLNDINSLAPKEKEALLLNIDAFLRDAKIRKAYAS